MSNFTRLLTLISLVLSVIALGATFMWRTSDLDLPLTYVGDGAQGAYELSPCGQQVIALFERLQQRGLDVSTINQEQLIKEQCK